MEWLSEFVQANTDIKNYCDRMTMTGSKVEGFEKQGEDIVRVVAGHVVAIERHPDSDHLFICQVDVGEEAPVQIVTGAQNVHQGDWVPAALDGSTLPGGVKIKKGKLRGKESCGMLCSLGELGLTVHDYPYAIEDGIFILQEPCTAGQDIREVLHLNDTVVEFEITPNRPDCLSMIGLARETAASFGTQALIPTPKVQESERPIEELLQVKVEESSLCLRYSARVVTDVKIQPSPAWLRRRLAACGVRPINNLVDITNYVMLEYGQPMHAFDYACLSGGSICVRRARADEPFVTLDSQTRKLEDSMLVIADAEHASALAGIMGGENSEIKDSTTTVVFESACFNGPAVRQTARRLGMRTESSARFEKGLCPENTMPALERACQLVEMLGAGKVCKGVIDVYPAPVVPVQIPFRPARINELLGTDIDEAFMKEALTSLGFVLENGTVTAPIWRTDIEGDADLAEEVVRMYGYDRIPSSLGNTGVHQGGLNALQLFERKLEDTALALGFDQTLTYSFVAPGEADLLCLAENDPLRRCLRIINPLSEDTSVMRTSVLPSMLRSLSHNANHRNEAARLFEIGKVYLPKEDWTVQPDEQKLLCLGFYGKGDFFAMKGVVERIFEACRMEKITFCAVKDHPSFHPGRCAKALCGDSTVALFGQVHPRVAAQFGLDTETYYAELPVEELFRLRGAEPVYTQLPKFPAVTRDLAIVCDEATEAGSVLACIRKYGGAALEKAVLFDVYRGAQLGEGKKSLAYSLSLRNPDHTLTVEEADKLTAKILRGLSFDLNATLR